MAKNFVKKALIALSIGLTPLVLNAMDYSELSKTPEQLIAEVMLQGNQGIANRVTKDNGTILHDAILKRRMDLVQVLLNNNAYRTTLIDLQDMHGDTALHYAVGEKQVDMARALLEARANIEISNYNDYTAQDLIDESDEEMINVFAARNSFNWKRWFYIGGGLAASGLLAWIIKSKFFSKKDKAEEQAA
jgi:hypothetical protein